MPQDFTPCDWRTDIIDMLPERVACAVANMPAAFAERVIELRIGSARPMLALDCKRDYWVAPDGQTAAFPAGALILTADECRRFMDYVTKYSIYAYADELKNGFLTIKGGYRVGVAGKTVVDGFGNLSGFGACTSFCIRIPREIKGAAGDLIGRIRRGGEFLNTLIVSPPGMGKTTLLRDLARLLGSDAGNRPGLRVCVIDERSEIAGGHGARRFDVGAKTDVLDGCPKSQGIMLALRSLNPQAVLTDEIGRPEDAAALEDALNCGVGIVATAHGAGIQDIMRRPVMMRMVNAGLFKLYIVIGGVKGIGGVTEVVYGLDGLREAQRAGGST
jgi:stage III sporulation protein AA